MKLKKLILISILLFFLMGAVSAQDNATLEDAVAQTQKDCILSDGAPVELIEYEDYNIEAPEQISSSWVNTVRVEMPRDATGNISISVDGNQRYNRQTELGGNALILNDLNLDYSISHDLLINYTGDAKYLGFTKQKTMNPLFSVDVADYCYDGYTLDVGFAKDLTGTVKILIDDEIVYNKPCSKGEPSINLDKYSATTHTYEAIYSKANTTLREKGTFTRCKFYFEANPMTSTEDFEYGDTLTYEIFLPQNSKGTAKFKNMTYEFTGNEDEYTTIDISGFEVGENIIEFTCNYGKITQKIIDRIEVKPKLNMPTMLWADGNYSLRFSSQSDFNGDLILSGMINNAFKVENGTLEVPITGLKCGKYYLNVKYENYTWDYRIQVLNETPELKIIHYYSSLIYVWGETYDWYDTMDYYIGVLSNYNLCGKTTVIHDNTTRIYDGGISFREMPHLIKGNHTLTVIYSNDTNIPQSNWTIEYEVRDCELEVSEYGRVFVQIPGSESGTLTVKVNGKTYKTKTIKATGEPYEIYNIDISTLKYGQSYDVEVSFIGKSVKANKTETINFTYPLEIYTSGDYEFIYLEDEVVEFILPNDIKSKPIVSIDGKSFKYKKTSYEDAFYYVDDDQDAYDISIATLKPGIHTVTVTYPGDAKYPYKSANLTFNITAGIEGPYSDYDYNSKIELKLALPKDASGNLTVLIRPEGEKEFGLFKTVSLKDGVCTINLPSNKTGKYEYISYFEGNYDIENCSSEISISPKISCPSSMYFGDDKQIRVSMENDSDAKLVLFVELDYESPIKIAEYNLNETNSVKISDLAEKIKAFFLTCYKATKTNYVRLKGKIYSENETYSFSDTTVFFVNRIVGLKSSSMYYGDAQYINLKVYDIYGKPVTSKVVTIKIGKYVFKAITSKKGIVKFKIPTKITPGTYAVTAAYKTAKVTAKLKVAKVLTLKTVKIKKSAKKLVLTVTLKKGKKPIKGKTVTFKFKGKTYKAKTNKYGIAKVTIKKSVLKKLKKGKKVTYQATYIKATVKKTAKVKK